MSLDTVPRAARRAVIIIPGSVNYFYNQCGLRLRESLATLGVAADIVTLPSASDSAHDICFFTSLSETLHAFGDDEAGLAKIRMLIRNCRYAAAIGIDCVKTPWYHKTNQLCIRTGIEAILDLGMCDQSAELSTAERSRYRFLFSGLTPSEERSLATMSNETADRPIPWAFVGHLTKFRAALVDHLTQAADPRGFVYMPAPAPYTEKSSPHLNQQQFEAVLRKTQFQVWTSHHEHFYMEPERFRASLLTGGVPVKVVLRRTQIPAYAPFRFLMLSLRTLAAG